MTRNNGDRPRTTLEAGREAPVPAAKLPPPSLCSVHRVERRQRGLQGTASSALT